MISREGSSGMSRFFYNTKNQQIRTETEDGQVQENRYDAEGLRYEVRENANWIRFVYHQGELLYEKGGEQLPPGRRNRGSLAVRKKSLLSSG